MPRFLKLLVPVCCAALVLAGCGDDSEPESSSLVENANVGAISPTSAGGIVYGDSSNGQLINVDGKGVADGHQLGTLNIATGTKEGIRGLTRDSDDRLFVSYVNTQHQLEVARITEGKSVVIWTGPSVLVGGEGQLNLAGEIGFTDANRILIAIGDLGDASKINADDAPNGKLLSLDPDGTPDQRPNALAQGFTNPAALTRDQSGSLWVADAKGDGSVELARVSNNGDRPDPTTIAGANVITGLSAYSQQELVGCVQGSHELQRYFLNGGTRAVPGRVLAKDCDRGLTELTDGRVAYIASTGVRVVD